MNFLEVREISEVIYKNCLGGGSIKIAASKSDAHRAVIAASLCVLQGVYDTECIIRNIDMNHDIKATIGAVSSLGVSCAFDGGRKELLICKGGNQADVIDCNESGSTLRFMIPIAAALGKSCSFIGRGRLPERPIGIYENILPRYGIIYESSGGLPLSISGKLKSGDYHVPGNISSQFITGFMFALSFLKEKSTITLTSRLESKGYVDMTIKSLRNFGIHIEEKENGWEIPKGQLYCPTDYTVEGDWSHSAFFLSTAALSVNGEKIRLLGLDKNSVQGDKACADIYRRFGLKVSIDESGVTAYNLNAGKPYGGLKGIRVNVSQTPDLVPAIAICAAGAEGRTIIEGAKRLRIKESDRLLAMENAINAIGGKCVSTGDSLIIDGVKKFNSAKINGSNDHRIVMSLAASALRLDLHEEIVVEGADCINKSYPNFFEDFKLLGGYADVVNVGRKS